MAAHGRHDTIKADVALGSRGKGDRVQVPTPPMGGLRLRHFSPLEGQDKMDGCGSDDPQPGTLTIET